MDRPDPQDVQRVIQAAMDLAREGDTATLAAYLDAGYPLEQADAEGNTVLMLAAYHGHVPTVEMLVERGADVDRLNARGQSPLAGAVFKGEEEVVQLLRRGGADPDLGAPSARDIARMFGADRLLGE